MQIKPLDLKQNGLNIEQYNFLLNQIRGAN